MPYRPKFCCQCGEKIERVDWKIWTSRRFCELCETDFGIHDKIPYIVGVLGILVGMFGIGSYWRMPQNVNNTPNQFISKAPQQSNTAETSRVNSSDSNSPVQTQTQENKNLRPKIAETTTAQNLTTKPRETASNAQTETVYMCGAATKKGTPCSRRVKGGGRCWQHAGQAAMVTQEKLILSNN